MCQCHIKDKINTLLSGVVLPRMRLDLNSLIFSHCVFCHLLSSSVCCMSLTLHFPECYLMILSFSVSLSVPKKWLCSVFIEQHKTHQMGKELRITLEKSLTEFYMRLSH